MNRYVKPLVKYGTNSQQVSYEFKIQITKLFDILYTLDSATFLDPKGKSFKYILQMYIYCFRKDNKNPSLDLKLHVNTKI